MQRIFPSVILVLLIALLAVFLVNLPSLFREQGLPLFPALLAGQACLIGLLICLYGLYVFLIEPLSNRNRLRRELARGTATPWLQNSQWASKRMSHTRAGKVLFLWLFVVNWWGALWFFASDRGQQIWEQSLPVMLLCVFLVFIGVVMLWSAIGNSINWAKFGTTNMFIDTLPGRPGQDFRGYIEIGFKPESRVPTTLQLTGFVRHWTQRIAAEGNRRVKDTHDEAPFHEREIRIKAAEIKATGRCFRVPVNVPIPARTRSSGACDDNSEVIWKLAIQTRSPNGSSFEADFEIPVFENETA
ncbi:MAG: hypothetical protein ABJM26_17710 [Anderseniella sp.]